MRYFQILTLTAIVGAALHAGAAEPTTAPTNPNALRVMTFNLRFGSPIPPHSWLERRPVMAALIKQAAPDLIGTQEGLIWQLKDMQHDHPEYKWIGVARNDGKEQGEHSAIFYRTDRLEVVGDVHNFWLSDTPEIAGSKNWGNNSIRMATWAEFRDKKTGQEFYVFNTHLDHQVEIAREKGAALIVKRINELKTDLPVIMTGDFNCGPTSVAHKTYTDAGFVDTWDTATEKRGPIIATYHGYKPPIKNGVRIDWILTRGPVKCDWIEIDTYQEKNQLPSDHFPVMCELRFTKQ